MENRRLALTLGFGLALVMLYYTVVIPWINRRYPVAQPVAATDTSTTLPGATSTQPSTAPEPGTSAATTNPSVAATQAGSIVAAPAQAHVVATTGPAPNVSPVALGSDVHGDGQFALQLRLDPVGASIERVVLNSFKMTAEGKDLYHFQEQVDHEAGRRKDTQALASRNITVNGVTYDLLGLPWNLESTQPTRATYSAELIDGTGKRLLTLRKTFQIFPRSDANEGYEVRVDYAFANDTDAPLKVKASFNGTTLPPAETNRSGDRELVAGYRADRDNIDINAEMIESLKADKDEGRLDLTMHANHRVAWAGAMSNYFGAVVLPGAMNGAVGPGDYIANVVAQGVYLDEKSADVHQAFVEFDSSEFQVPAHATTTLPLHVFLGPKWRQVLDTSYYGSYPRKYDLMLIIRSSYCGFLTFNWLVSGIVVLLGFLQHYVLRDWGLAIIGLVAIVRLILHPITKQSQVSMARMQKLGPEMKRLQEKYKDDKDALNKAMVEYHKEQGIGPYLGCLPMFLQMPIWIALYGVLQSTFELRHAPFLWNFTWIHDLSQPDYLFRFAHAIPFIFGSEIRGINLVPVLLAGVMAIQQQFMPKPAAATPEQLQQQRLMQWLSPAMFLVFFYNLPSGLNLYIFTSTAVGIIESKIVRDHIRQREEAEKAGRVFVETKPTRGARRGRAVSSSEEPARRGWLAQRWARLLEQAEQMQKEQERRQNGKKR